MIFFTLVTFAAKSLFCDQISALFPVLHLNRQVYIGTNSKAQPARYATANYGWMDGWMDESGL